MRRFFLAFMLFFAFAGLARAGEKVLGESKGVDWVLWDEERKNTFVSGFIAGSNYVIWGNLEKLPAYDEAEAEEVLKKYLREMVEPSGDTFGRGEASILRDVAVHKAKEEANKNLMDYVIYNSVNKGVTHGLD